MKHHKIDVNYCKLLHDCKYLVNDETCTFPYCKGHLNPDKAPESNDIDFINNLQMRENYVTEK